MNGESVGTEGTRLGESTNLALIPAGLIAKARVVELTLEEDESTWSGPELIELLKIFQSDATEALALLGITQDEYKAISDKIVAEMMSDEGPPRRDLSEAARTSRSMFVTEKRCGDFALGRNWPNGDVTIGSLWPLPATPETGPGTMGFSELRSG